MKTKIHTFLSILFIINVFSQEIPETIQQDILNAYQESAKTQIDQYIPIIEQLESISNQSQKKIANYWIAFARYQQAILYSNANRKEDALEILNKGIKKLKNSKNPTSEDLALHGSMVSFSIQFQDEIAAILSSEANKLYGEAIKMDSNNLRAYLGIGKSDYYRPKEYGGGYKVESYLKDSLTKPDKTSESALAPSWGREQSYYYLAKFYVRVGWINKAKEHAIKGLKEYPNNRLLNSLKKELNL